MKGFMNIVYLLTNTSKIEGRRYYIGSKQECQIGEIDGVPTIIDREGKPYYSSSSSLEFREDVFKGDIFVASVLEEVYDRKSLLEAENRWIDTANAVYSDEYYNITNAVLNCHNQDTVANLYGETVFELAKNNSAASKRDNSAKELGYQNFGELCFDIWDRYCKNNNWQVVSESFGKERHWACVTVKPYDMEKAKEDLSKVTQEDVRKLISKKCSLKKVAEILNIEIPAARVLLGDFNKTAQKTFLVAAAKGKTQGELEAEITRDILDGMGWLEVTKKHAVNETSAKRYFMRCIRRHLAPEDISDTIYETEEALLEAKKKRKNKQQRMADFKDSLKNVKDVPSAKNTQANNKSGVVGVYSRNNKGGMKWVAQWIDNEGKKRSKEFDIATLGNEEAFRLACEHRAKMIEELNKQGAGYTERHEP